MGGTTVRGIGLAVVALLGLAGCAALGFDEEFPPATPPAAASHFKVTPPGSFPYDAYLSAWGSGYVIHVPGRAPIYLVSDKQGGFIVQSLGEAASFVARREDGSGWTILTGSEPPTLLIKQDVDTWLLQPPGGLPTLIVPQ
jgi:hypothetical protein